MLKNISQQLTHTLNKATQHLTGVVAWLKRPILPKSNYKTLPIRLSYHHLKYNLPNYKYTLPAYHQLNSQILGRYEIIYWYNTLNPKKVYHLHSKLISTSPFFYTINPYHCYYKNDLIGKYSLANIAYTKQMAMVVYEDKDTLNLKVEISSLESDIGYYDGEKAELEKLLADFNHRHMLELGDVIAEILALKKQIAKQNEDEIAFEEMEHFEQEYHQELHQQKQKIRHQLHNDDKKQLKKLYRKASSLCHPDRVSDEQKSLAQELFNELRCAYEENDLPKVRQLLSELERGIFEPKSKTISQKDKLKTLKQQMQGKLQRIINAINDIKKSPSYQEIMEIDDWDSYFAEQKSLLLQEKERLRERLLTIKLSQSIEPQKH